MLLAVDAGNTQTVVGLYELDGGTSAGRRPEAGLLDHWRISTAADRTSDEYAVMLQGFLALRRNSFSDIDGIVISSGVPRVTATLRQVTDRHFDFEPIVVGPGIRSGIRIDYDNPKEVGADRIANAVGAYDLYGGPTIIADFGTATTCDAFTALPAPRFTKMSPPPLAKSLFCVGISADGVQSMSRVSSLMQPSL